MGFLSKKVLPSLFFALCLAMPSLSAEPEETQLTAAVMDYDTLSGEFKAKGNVALKRSGVTILSPIGWANTKTQKARMWDGIKGSGIHQGEKIDFTCDELESDFAVAEGDYTMKGNVDATFGSRHLLTDLARLREQRFYASPVKRFEDYQRKLQLVCNAIQGDFDSLGLHYFIGTGSVYVHQINEKKATTEIWSDKLVYVREKDSLTATGNARAVQKGRRITAKTLIYYPKTGKLEAQGAPRITVDVEKNKKGAQDGSGKKGSRQGAWVKNKKKPGSAKP